MLNVDQRIEFVNDRNMLLDFLYSNNTLKSLISQIKSSLSYVGRFTHLGNIVVKTLPIWVRKLSSKPLIKKYAIKFLI